MAERDVMRTDLDRTSGGSGGTCGRLPVLSLRTLQPAVPAHVRVVAEIVNASNCELLLGEPNLEFVREHAADATPNW